MQKLFEEAKNIEVYCNTPLQYQELIRENLKLKEENEQLRGIFQLAVKEFEKREQRIKYLEQELSEMRELEEENRDLKQQLKQAQAQINILNSMLFGRSSEKSVEPTSNDTPLDYDNWHQTRREKKRGAVPGHKGYGRKIPNNLPVKTEIIDLPENERKCPCCGKPFIEIELEQVSSEISVKKEYYIKRTLRKVYKKTCNCVQTKELTLAPPPPKIIPKGKFSIEFWVSCLIDKYNLHLPVGRQIFEMKLYGLEVTPGTIFGGFKKLYLSYLVSLYQAMAIELRKASHWHADESRWYIFIEREGKNNYNWVMWCYISEEVVLFVLDPTRSAKVPYKVLFDIDIEEIEKATSERALIENNEKTRILSADRYSAYKVLQKRGLLVIAYCWAHVRRDFIDLKTKYESKELCLWADEWIRGIGKLYRINNKRVKYKPDESMFIKYNEKLKEMINRMYVQIQAQYQHSAQIEIMNSMKEHWEGLTLFVKHPEIPMDNNLAERTIRPMVLGRKNYWGNHSEWGGELSAAMFSIIQTCLLHNISPQAYLEYYFRECAKRGSAPDEEEIAFFLPHKLNEDMKQKLKITEPQILDSS